MLRTLMASVGAAVFCSAAFAAELTSLSEWLSQPEDSRESSYLHIRCAALYQGVFDYMGEDNLSADAAENMKGSFRLNALAARYLRAEDSPDEPAEALTAAVVRDVSALSKVYNDRLHENYRLTGQSIVSDDLVSGDLEVCREVTAAVGLSQQ